MYDSVILVSKSQQETYSLNHGLRQTRCCQKELHLRLVQMTLKNRELNWSSVRARLFRSHNISSTVSNQIFTFLPSLFHRSWCSSAQSLCVTGAGALQHKVSASQVRVLFSGKHRHRCGCSSAQSICVTGACGLQSKVFASQGPVLFITNFTLRGISICRYVMSHRTRS
jgi:hypothetical protein